MQSECFSTSTFHKNYILTLVSIGGKTRITFFGLDGTAQKLFPVFRVMGANNQIIFRQ